MNYCSKERVSELVAIAQAERQLPVELCDVIAHIISGLIKRTGMKLDPLEMSQDAIIIITSKMDNIDPEKNAFSYMTTICFNVLRQAYRRNQTQLKVKGNYAVHLRQTGGQVTDV